jgi:hypothetical protein
VQGIEFPPGRSLWNDDPLADISRARAGVVR